MESQDSPFAPMYTQRSELSHCPTAAWTCAPAVCVCAQSRQSCLTLQDTMDCSSPGSSVHGIFQTRILEWVAISFSSGPSQPRDWTCVSCTAGGFFTHWAPWEAYTPATHNKYSLHSHHFTLRLSKISPSLTLGFTTGLVWPMECEHMCTRGLAAIILHEKVAHDWRSEGNVDKTWAQPDTWSQVQVAHSPKQTAPVNPERHEWEK